MKRFLMLLAAGAVGLALAQSPNPDQTFYDKAAQGGMAEVAAAKLAQSKAQRADVKQFADMMVKDHGKANAKLQALATKKSVKLPASTDAKHKAASKELEGLSGAAFEEAYIRGQIEDHENTVELLKYEIDSGADPDAKAFANEILPTVQAHLKEILRIAKDAGVKR